MISIYVWFLWTVPVFAEPPVLVKTIEQTNEKLNTCHYLQVSLMELYRLATQDGSVVGELDKVVVDDQGQSRTVALTYQNKIAYTDADVAAAQIKRCGRRSS